MPGGVINVFNLTDHEQAYAFNVPCATLNTTQPLRVTGAQATWAADHVTLSLTLAPMSPALIEVGLD